jgi:hypothetical protein
MDSKSGGEFRIQAPACPRCRVPRFVFAVNSGFSVVCPSCKRQNPLHSLPLSEQNRIRTELAIVPSGSSVPRAANPTAPMQDPKRRNASEREPSVKRFWLKEQELKLLGQSMQMRASASAHDSEGRLIEVNWHDPHSELARRFRSTFELRRHRKSRERQPRTIWVRPDEVAAALSAMEKKKPVPIGEGGEAGRAVYFSPSSTEAQRFRAQICVERIRR